MARVVRSRLKELIDELSRTLGFKVTPTHIANATGIRQPTIAAWASGKTLTQIDLKVLFALADYFGIENPWDLLVIMENDNPPELDAPPVLWMIGSQVSTGVTFHFSL